MPPAMRPGGPSLTPVPPPASSVPPPSGIPKPMMPSTRAPALDPNNPLSAVVQAMRKTQQTALYLEHLGPFFVGRALWQSTE